MTSSRCRTRTELAAPLLNWESSDADRYSLDATFPIGGVPLLEVTVAPQRDRLAKTDGSASAREYSVVVVATGHTVGKAMQQRSSSRRRFRPSVPTLMAKKAVP